MASHALLLRLFLSPSFFSVHVALQYLRSYGDNIGITYYLTRRLREADTRELENVWGFICHLLVTRPSKSRALECFVVEIAQRSTHIAMITLWFMQAALRDLAHAPHDSQSFAICQRLIHHCHEIIYGDLPSASATPYSALKLPFNFHLVRTKVKPHLEPSLIGMGMVLAGTVGMPRLTAVMGEVAVEQGRAPDETRTTRSIGGNEDEVVRSPTSTAQDLEVDDNDQEGSESPDEDSSRPPALENQQIQSSRSVADLSLHTRRSTVSAAQTSPVLPLHLRDLPKPRLSEDPLGQNEPPSPVSTSPFQSFPALSLTKHLPRSQSLNTTNDILSRYDTASQVHLLRSHYCSAEVQFILTLESISNRLLIVPKPARVSALRAELTALNHNLPAEVCMPMWCSSSDSIKPPSQIPHPHHRIVRIPPGESVVLNSAERAPYLLLVEIINGDLDFDPTKRGNKEVLKKIITKESQRKGASRDLITFGKSTTSQRSRNVTDLAHNSAVVLGKDSVEGLEAPKVSTPAVIQRVNHPDSSEEDEVDLIEQLYGANQSLRSQTMDLSDSIVLPPPPKNKELEMATWSRASSAPPSPSVDSPSAFHMLTPANTSFGVPRRSQPPSQLIPQGVTSGSPSIERGLSLDDYSDRMRTAAVMLAQLNANAVREVVVSSGSQHPDTSSRSWIPGPSWRTSTSEQSNVGGPLHPSLTGSGGVDQSGTGNTRMRVQHSEAAAIRERIMQEMIALEEERMERMREQRENEGLMRLKDFTAGKTPEDENIIRRELNKADPSAVVFSETWAAKKSRIRQNSPYGHLANWDCISVIVKTGGDLRQEQLAVHLIQEFERIWKEEKCPCWVRYYRILITGGTSGLMETITDSVSIHSIKKAEYARRLAEGRLGHVTLLDHFKMSYGDPSSAKFARAQRNFAQSLAGYSIVTYLLQIKDRHNGNILLDREGHLIHIDFGFMLSNSPGNIGFEAAPFKLAPEYIEVLGGVEGQSFLEFRRLFRDGFEAARKHCDRIITLVELMQKDSTLPCFAAFGDQTAAQLRDRFQPTLTHSLVGEHVDRLIDSSLGSNWTRLYDSYQYYSQSIL